MKESSKVLIGLGLGLVAGGVAGYFLASEEGREFQRKTKAQLDQLSSDVKSTLKENTNVASEKVSEMSTSAKDWASQVSDAVKQKISKTADVADEAVEEVTSDFQSGVEKARRKINEQSASVNGAIDNA